MPTDPKLPDPARLLRELQTNASLRHQRIAEAGLDPRLAELRAWQSARLAATYADLLDDRRYRLACQFFLSDIYAPRDFSQRDHDAERIHAVLSRVVPAPMLKLLTDAIALNTLTRELDDRLAQALFEAPGAAGAITPERYAEAYRLCDNFTARVRQLDLIRQVVLQLGEGARLPAVGLALKVVRGPAQAAGWSEVYAFAERGYTAFRQMRDARPFADTILRREKRLLDRIFSADPDPFGPDTP